MPSIYHTVGRQFTSKYSFSHTNSVVPQETSDQLLAAILDLSAGDRQTGRGAINGGVNFAEQTSQDILEVYDMIV